MNLIVFDGNLVEDVRVVKTKNDNLMYCFRVASNNRRKNTNFYNVTATGKQGENCLKYLKKGSRVLISGEISLRSYKEGEKTISYLDVDMEKVTFLSAFTANERTEKSDTGKPKKMVELSVADDDDIPF